MQSTIFNLILRTSAFTIMFLFYAFNGSSQGSAFECSSDLYQVVDGNTLKKLDPATGTYSIVGTSDIKYNGAGFNVEDNYIYGIGEGTTLVQIDNEGQALNLGSISDFSAISYSGDLDTAGNWYSFKKSDQTWALNKLDVSVLPPVVQKFNVTELNGEGEAANCADIAYNPVTKKFYGIGGEKLIEFDPFNFTVRVIKNYENDLPGGGYGAVWSDKEGNTYFFNNGTGNIYRASFNNEGEVLSFAFLAVSSPNGSNDGMSCSYAAPVAFPEICNNGIDDDNDGLVDCDDPDCTANAHCTPKLVAEIGSVSQTCYSSIVPFFIRVINNGYADVTGVNIQAQLPEGFIFDSDTLDLGLASTYDNTIRPVNGALSTINWEQFDIEKQDTLVINFSALTNGSISNGNYAYNVTVESNEVEDITGGDNITIDRSTCDNPPVFQCVPAFYQVYKKRGQPNVYGRLNPESGDYTKIALMDHQANGLGFDVVSSMTYGASGKKFIRLADDGNVTYLGLDFEKKCFVGDMDMNGHWFGKVGSNMVKVDVSIPAIVATYTGQGMPGWDMAYNIDGNFYAIHSNQLYTFNTTTNTKSSLGAIVGTVPTSGYGAQWTGSDGFLYASNNATGEIYKINVETRKSQLVMIATSGLRFNDGFSCPTELPAVFDYEYSDYNGFGLASNLIYTQDLGYDNVPDFDGVWLGSKVSYDPADPSNIEANGDSFDDGLSFPTDLKKGTSYDAQIGLNTHKTQKDIFWAMWIDWDNDQNPDNFYSGQENSIGAVSVTQPFSVPEGQTSGKVAVRLRISELLLEKEDLNSHLIGIGEVEDYVFNVTIKELNCENGVDDDGDGLIDCDDPDCAAAQSCTTTTTGTGGEGGLESNDRLSSKIALTQFKRSKAGKLDFDDKTQLPQLVRDNHYGMEQSSSSRGGFDLKAMIPIDVIPQTETFITSPEHLIGITNASEVFAVDVFNGNDRVAAILALQSQNGVYEHTKYVCDRLNGSSILDILSYKIDGENDYIIAKIQLPNGNIEYATSISLRVNEENEFSLESFWNLEFYTKETSFYNFQIWANNTERLVGLVMEIERLANVQSPITSFKMGTRPEVFVNSAKLRGGKLDMQLTNNSGISLLNAHGNISESETETSKRFDQDIELNRDNKEQLSIEVGSAYDLGITLHHEASNMPDVIFLADGAWGTDYDLQEEVQQYEVKPSYHADDEAYWIERDVLINGTVKNSVAVFRAFSPSFRSVDLQEYNQFNFDAAGLGEVEVTLVKSSIQDWADQPRITITLTEEMTQYSFRQKDFSTNADWQDLTMVVFDVKGNTTSNEPFSMNIANTSFGTAVISNVGTDVMESTARAYPNPATDGFNIDFYAAESGDYLFELLDTSGRIVMQQSAHTFSGSNTITVDKLQDLKGIYFYNISINRQQYRGKIILRD